MKRIAEYKKPVDRNAYGSNYIKKIRLLFVLYLSISEFNYDFLTVFIGSHIHQRMLMLITTDRKTKTVMEFESYLKINRKCSSNEGLKS